MTDKQLQKVEIHPASWWYCEHCGEKNFEEHGRPSENEREIFIAELMAQGLSAVDATCEIDAGPWELSPVEVKCRSCGAEFETYWDEEGVEDGQ